ncbi:SOS response-associated peptidase family protein [Roseateles sp. SL47]|uniref:SOS response-associated peptidase family protein n=1 Tax=Roseateles sp. SL47 TaxID=2995138 RepID=UPI00226E292A|nr:SOS response-associated peptidase family protein [Roseateles sp. SL47]WAC72055.1 SOS response-associated peptidase family protein [Roseateles sp. SL47]
MTPKTDLEVYVRRHLTTVWLPENPEKPFVVPFDPGLFLRPDGDGLQGVVGQWAMIRPGAPARKDMIQSKAVPGKKPAAPRPRSTNNARTETVATTPTFRAAWNEGRRCLIPAAWYQEPNWETGRNIWWQLRRTDGLPWMLAGIWNEWVYPATGEVVPNYTMLTMNCDGHPLLARLHKPDPKLPPDAQDKRAVIHVEPQDWAAWLRGTEADARMLLRTQPAEFCDQADAQRTDALLAQLF